MTLEIKNWKRFQHFKDRKPIWIKLYRDILEQRDIVALSDRSFRVLIGCWLLASENEGELPDVDDIAFRLRLQKRDIIKALQELAPFVIQDDSNPISNGYQGDAPEKRREEVETEKRREETEYTNDFLEFWKVYPKRKDKGTAFRAWQKAKKRSLPPLEALIAIVEAHKETHEWKKENWKYVLKPHKWLNGDGWEDEIGPLTDSTPKHETKFERIRRTTKAHCEAAEREEAEGVEVGSFLQLGEK